MDTWREMPPRHRLSGSPGASPGHLLGWKVVLRTVEDWCFPALLGVLVPRQPSISSQGNRNRSGKGQTWPHLQRLAAQRLAQQAQEQGAYFGGRGWGWVEPSLVDGSERYVGQRGFLGELDFPVRAPADATGQRYSKRSRASLTFLWRESLSISASWLFPGQVTRAQPPFARSSMVHPSTLTAPIYLFWARPPNGWVW